jgi:hypothetical protein
VPPKHVRHENRLMLTLLLGDTKIPSVACGVANVSTRKGVTSWVREAGGEIRVKVGEVLNHSEMSSQ